MSILVIDVGTSGLRAGVVDGDGELHHLHHRSLPPATPFPGLVEVDATAMAAAVLDTARAALADHGGPVRGVGVTTQRATTIVWDRATGDPVGPGLGWQDLRTVLQCITARSDHGLHLAPNQSATKLAWLLDTYDAGRERDLCFGTVDSWIAWVLTEGAVHATDASNAAITGLLEPDASGWSPSTCAAFGVPMGMLPTVVDSSGDLGPATALPGAPPLCALIGDQQGSLIGQSCVAPGAAKITFGTGGMLDACTGPDAPARSRRSVNGTFPIVAWRRDGAMTWGVEAIMLSAGTNIEWLRDDLGIIDDAADSHHVAAQCADTGGVVYVPALLGLGTPAWDYGERGTLLGLTSGSVSPEVERAVLEWVAHRGADLVDAAVADGVPVDALRVDGGMAGNPTFVQALADATGRVVEVARLTEATTLGAAYLAGLATGMWSSFDEIAAAWRPRHTVEPGPPLDRARWAEAVGRAAGWIPDLSALDF